MLKGIDVSYCQANIDWAKVKASGITFAFIKSSQGGSKDNLIVNPFSDRYFVKNIANAYAAGVKCGVYHFMSATTIGGAIKEADYLIKLLEPHREKITYPVAIDFEFPRYQSISKTENTKLIRILVDKIRTAGYTPILYANRYFLNSFIDLSQLTDVDIWIALYYTNRNYVNTPKGFSRLTAWQWTNKGLVDGISGEVDLNVCYKDYSTREKGDIDGDGDIDSKDALILKRAILGTYTLTDEQKVYADMDGDGEISAKDFLRLRRKLLQ